MILYDRFSAISLFQGVLIIFGFIIFIDKQRPHKNMDFENVSDNFSLKVN